MKVWFKRSMNWPRRSIVTDFSFVPIPHSTWASEVWAWIGMESLREFANCVTSMRRNNCHFPAELAKRVITELVARGARDDRSPSVKGIRRRGYGLKTTKKSSYFYSKNFKFGDRIVTKPDDRNVAYYGVVVGSSKKNLVVRVDKTLKRRYFPEEMIERITKAA